MSWLWERTSVLSEMNEKITATRFLGEWSVSAAGCLQTCSYTDDLWKTIIRNIELPQAHHILVLGLGGGGVLPLLLKKYPNARITAVEWDEHMIALTQRIQKKEVMTRVVCVRDDVSHFIANMEQVFDLILVDIFTGKEIPPALHEKHFFQHIRRNIAQDGYVLVNAFAQPTVLERFQEVFSEWRWGKYHVNHWGIYRHRWMGSLGEDLPDGFFPLRSNAAYMSRELHGTRRSSLVGTRPSGVRTDVGWWHFEKYHSDSEPSAERAEKPRLIIWHPTSRIDTPKGWFSTKSLHHAGLMGYAPLDERYEQSWSAHARRWRTQWLHKSGWEIRPIELSEYIGGYRRGGKALFVGVLKTKKEAHGDLMICWGAFYNGVLCAGSVVLDVPEISQSYYLSSFILPSAKKSLVGYGLMDNWFATSLEKKLKFLNFGSFWCRGEPSSWRGFSEFKAKFGICYHRYPQPLIRIVR